MPSTTSIAIRVASAAQTTGSAARTGQFGQREDRTCREPPVALTRGMREATVEVRHRGGYAPPEGPGPGLAENRWQSPWSRRKARLMAPDPVGRAAAPMVNHALTSPPLWWRKAPCGGRFRRPHVESMARNDRRPPHRPSRPEQGRRPLAVRAAARTAGRHRARQAGDQPLGRRAAASDSALRRTGAAGASQRFRPLSGQQGHRRLPQGRRRLARPALPARRAGRSRDRNDRARRHPRGPVPRRDRRQALRRRSAPASPRS